MNKQSEAKRKIGIFEMTGCQGCEIAISNQEEQIQKIANILSFPMKTNEKNLERMDLALVEGQIASYEDLDFLKKIREKTKYLVAVGTCATEGNFPEAVVEYGKARDVERRKLLGDSDFTPLEDIGSLDDFVEVDYYLRGCPVREEELLQFLEKFVEENFQKNEDLRLPFLGEKQELNLQSDSIKYNPNKCILCRRCEKVCNDVMDVHAIGMVDRGPEANVSTPFGESLDESGCIYCGQCVENCPVGAFDVKSSLNETMKLLESDEKKNIVVLDTISIVSLDNVFSSYEENPPLLLSKLISALKEIGADEVWDYSPYLQLSAVAQAKLLNNNEKIVSSWCPSARYFSEYNFSESENVVHEETSPENILSQHILSNFGEESVNIILISPCIAQKEKNFADAVITPREIPQLLGRKDIWLETYYKKSEDFDNDLAPWSRKMLQGYENISYSPYILKIADKLNDSNAEVSLNSEVLEEDVEKYHLEGENSSYTGLVIRRLSKAEKFLSEKHDYDIIEMIPCPYGCITGGGQFPTSSTEDVEGRFEKLEELNNRVKPSKSSFRKLIEAYKDFSEET